MQDAKAEDIAALQARLESLVQELDDVKMALDIAVEHGDAIESELSSANTQLLNEIAQREEAQRRLQALVEAVGRQKDDLEIIMGTLVEHGDSMDRHMWEELLLSEKRSATDALTNLPNRRAFDEGLSAQMRNCARHGKPISLLICDVDYFKPYNDTYGHPMGDECLRQVASVIAGKAHRASDLAARYGGEEFAVILGECDTEKAQQTAEGIVAEVRALNIEHKGSKGSVKFVTISIGHHTILPSAGDEPGLLLARADHMLYRAKQRGRNQAFSESLEAERDKGQVMESNTYGHFSNRGERGQEYLELAFSPSSRPLNMRWRNNGLSADFLADYFGTFIPKDLPESHHNQVKGAVAFIANELLENAMKFSDGEGGRGISLSLDLTDHDLCCTLNNVIRPENEDQLLAFLEEFTSMDASDYFVTRMERNMETGSESGLGFATMITDHDAKVGWKIQALGGHKRLTTQVVIEI